MRCCQARLGVTMASYESDNVAEINRHIHSDVPSDPALRVKALESLLVERGMVAPETLDAWVEAYSEHIGPKRGAQVVARAWRDDWPPEGGGEYGRDPPSGHLYALFLLPLLHSWHVAGLVQID